jgi:hypothetical protein
MKVSSIQFCVLLLCLLCSSIVAQNLSQYVISDERPLYDRRNYPMMPGGIRGDEVDMDLETRVMKVNFSKAGSGVKVNVQRSGVRFNPIPYFDDPFPAVEVRFRSKGTLPENLTVQLHTLNQDLKPSVRKTIRTETVASNLATDNLDGWKTLRFPFPERNLRKVKHESEDSWDTVVQFSSVPTLEISSGDIIEQVRIIGTSEGSMEVSKISFVKLRNISIKLENSYEKNTVRLEVVGQINRSESEVTLQLEDATGGYHEKILRSKEGHFRFVWENPPIQVGAESVLYATVADGKSKLDHAVPLPVYGYLDDTSHIWLSVHGKDIVTSPNSKGGSQKFYSTGVGYAKNVIVRGYDEEVAEYCKTMGLNTIRLSFYTSFYNNRAHEPLQFDDITAFIDPVIKAAKKHNLYVILNDHSYFKNEIDEETARGEQKASGWTTERFTMWVNRWRQVAEYYKDEPYILGYELCNEPVCDPETARKWYGRCINEVRSVDKRHIILVGTHHWSHARALEATWSGVADKIDRPYNNVVFSFHDYPLDNNPWEVQSYISTFRNKYNVPVLCTEFGAGGKPEIVHREFQAGMMALFAFEKVGWMIWSLYYSPDLAMGFPTRAIQNPEDKTWNVQKSNPGYWIPFVELWAPAAKIMGSSFPQPKKEK